MKSAKIGKKGQEHPKITTVPRCRGLGHRCKVVSRANHIHMVLELAFTNLFGGLEAARKRKSCNFGRFGPCRAYH